MSLKPSHSPRVNHHRPWPLAARLMVSILLSIYLTAVVLPPLAGPPPASELAMKMLQPFRPLIGGLALSHGYRFFAPNPGPGHSIRWSMVDAKGTVKTGTIPDAANDRPRLLYHRRFMIPEKLAAFVPFPDAPADLQREAALDWQPLAKDIATRLLTEYRGKEVTLELIEHYLPDPFEVQEGRGGEDLVTPLGRYTWREGGSE
jgi:hypothetical protein